MRCRRTVRTIMWRLMQHSLHKTYVSEAALLTRYYSLVFRFGCRLKNPGDSLKEAIEQLTDYCSSDDP
jgi:hypothetical protein